MFLLKNTPEIVTYKYINTKTKQLDSILFQNFQKFYDEEKLTWKTPDNHFFFNVKKVTLNGRDNNYQIIKKKFNERDFLYLLSLANTFYVKVGHKVYQSIDWIKYFFENTTQTRYLEGEPVWKLEEIRQKAFTDEKTFERKIVICRLEEFRKMNCEQKKAAVLLITFPNGKEGPVITLRVTSARFFVSKYMYWGSTLNSLHGLKFIKEENARTELGLDIEETYIYEFALQTTNRHVV